MTATPSLFAEPQKNGATPGLSALKAERDLRGKIWARIYSTLWYPVLPFALLAAGDADSRRERLGGVPVAPHTGGKLRVWLHAASVGEIEGVRPVVQGLARVRPDLEFIITTMTLAGRDTARRRLNGISQLAPFDHAGAVRAFMTRVRPVLVIVAETELWPNFFLQSAKCAARVALINARLSSRSMSRYRLVRPLIAHALKSAYVVLAQTTEDAERFRLLGAASDRVTVTGNPKYEVDPNPPSIRPALASFAKDQPILIAGSTGPGEEGVALRAYCRLVNQFPSLALILAPRHLHRSQEVERLLQAAGLAYTRASEAKASAQTSERAANNNSMEQIGPRDPDVLLLDTIGDLRALYSRASIAFVGGSLMPGRGGQSLAEPANAAVPVLFGPYYDNHRQLGDALVGVGAGRVVSDATQLANAGANWLSDDVARRAAGRRGRSVIEQFAGISALTVRYLCDLLPVC
jgi:3-deoxy-D-manno-octulosonic-acid transferase